MKCYKLISWIYEDIENITYWKTFFTREFETFYVLKGTSHSKSFEEYSFDECRLKCRIV